LIKELQALKTRPFITDTSTLYSGRRRNAVDHVVVAAEHGFSLEALGIPFIVADGLFGTAEATVQIDGEINREVYIAYDITRCQASLMTSQDARLSSQSHTSPATRLPVPGPPSRPWGWAVQRKRATLGMGCATKKGKIKQHAALKLSINDNCTLCRQCYEHCPAQAITLGEKKAEIDQDRCISCAECLAVCRFSAVKCNWGPETEILQKSTAEYALGALVKCNWGPETEILQKSTAEYALGALKGKRDKAVFFNFLMSITKDCDCFDEPDMPSIVGDIGILASTDPVALDKASVDLVERTAAKKLGELIGNDQLDARHQIEHAQKIGLGSARYELIEVS